MVISISKFAEAADLTGDPVVFGGDGSDGNVIISSDTATSGVKNYNDLTIDNNMSLTAEAGEDLVILVAGDLVMGASSKIHVNGRSALAPGAGSSGTIARANDIGGTTGVSSVGGTSASAGISAAGGGGSGGTGAALGSGYSAGGTGNGGSGSGRAVITDIIDDSPVSGGAGGAGLSTHNPGSPTGGVSGNTGTPAPQISVAIEEKVIDLYGRARFYALRTTDGGSGAGGSGGSGGSWSATGGTNGTIGSGPGTGGAAGVVTLPGHSGAGSNGIAPTVTSGLAPHRRVTSGGGGGGGGRGGGILYVEVAGTVTLASSSRISANGASGGTGGTGGNITGSGFVGGGGGGGGSGGSGGLVFFFYKGDDVNSLVDASRITAASGSAGAGAAGGNGDSGQAGGTGGAGRAGATGFVFFTQI